MIAYIDESGFPHPNDGTKNPVLAAVCVPFDEIRSISQKMYNIKVDIFGRYDVELKAVNVLKSKSLTRNTNNKLFTDRVVQEVLLQSSGVKIFAIVMDQVDEMLEVERATFPNHYRFLLQRINGFAAINDTKCLVSFDSQDEGNDMLISHKMKNYLFRSNEGNKCTSIVESAFFVSSRVEEGIQLADLCAGIIRKYHEGLSIGMESDLFNQWVCSLYQKVYSLTSTVLSPNREHVLHGIYKLPNRLMG